LCFGKGEAVVSGAVGSDKEKLELPWVLEGKWAVDGGSCGCW
jgi:hypothetical protein